MLKWLTGKKEYWAPVALALGVTAVGNGITSLSKFVSADPPLDGRIYFPPIIVNIIFGLGLIILGFTLPKKTKELLIATLITAGFSLFFVGTNITYTYHWIGLILIILALITVGIGIRFSPK